MPFLCWKDGRLHLRETGTEAEKSAPTILIKLILAFLLFPPLPTPRVDCPKDKPFCLCLPKRIQHFLSGHLSGSSFSCKSSLVKIQPHLHAFLLLIYLMSVELLGPARESERRESSPKIANSLGLVPVSASAWFAFPISDLSVTSQYPIIVSHPLVATERSRLRI